MGKLFTARMPDGSERFAGGLSMGRAQLFFDMTKLLEKHLECTSGIADDIGEDEHVINPGEFIKFFECFWQQHDWMGERQSGFYHAWAAIAAGMIENITLTPRRWVDRNGEVLTVNRYQRPDEV
ncbi:MAG: hypothetical protein U0996_21565 [Planctomycetaceae bacterium]